MKLIGGFQDTRTNKEDFALTPFLFGVWYRGVFTICGIGLCWGWYSAYLGIGFNIPKGIPRFRIYSLSETNK